jgi:YVTN family beta-propeller protein
MGERETRAGAGDVRAFATAFSRGQEFAGHLIEAEIGRGGMGIVYRARHLALDRERALKIVVPVLSADPAFRRRFQRESRLAASVEHPNLVPVHHAGEEAGALYLSMRLIGGPDLRRIVEGEGPLPLDRTIELISQVAAGLDAAHARGLIHRDVKPANVLVERDGEGERVFLTDFGISRVAGAGGTLTSSAGFIGSVDYVAPEQIEGEETDQRVDVYALGCLLHFVLTGQPPFIRDGDMAKLYAHGHAPRPRPSALNPALPTAIDAIVARAMAIDPGDRYASGGEVAFDLRQLERLDIAAVPPLPGVADGIDSEPTTRRLELSRSRRRLWIAVAAGVVVALAAAIAVVLFQGNGGNAPPSPRSQKPAAPSGAPPAKVVATAKVGAGPVGLTVADAGVWIAALQAHELDRVSAMNPGRKVDATSLPGSPVSVASGFGSLWVAIDSQNSVLRVDPGGGGIVTSIPVGTNPSDVAVDSHWIWVANKSSNTVSRIDPATNQVDRTINVGQSPWSIATGAGSVWVANIDGGSVSEIDPALGRVVGKPITVGERPNDLAVGYGFVWVTDVFNGTVTRIDPSTAKLVGGPIEVGARPRGVKTGVGYVWVANGGSATVSRIDPKTAKPAGPPIHVGKNPADIAIGDGAVWTANFDDATVSQIRTNRR